MRVGKDEKEKETNQLSKHESVYFFARSLFAESYFVHTHTHFSNRTLVSQDKQLSKQEGVGVSFYVSLQFLCFLKLCKKIFNSCFDNLSHNLTFCLSVIQ